MASKDVESVPMIGGGDETSEAYVVRRRAWGIVIADLVGPRYKIQSIDRRIFANDVSLCRAGREGSG